MIKRGCLNFLLSASLLSGGVCLGGAPLHASPSSGSESDQEMDLLLTRAAEKSVESVSLLEGQVRSRQVNATWNLTRNIIIVQLDREFVPSDHGPAFEDQRSLIDNALLAVAERVQHVPQVKYLYGGYDIYHYFPELKEEDDAAREAGERKWRDRQENRARGTAT